MNSPNVLLFMKTESPFSRPDGASGILPRRRGELSALWLAIALGVAAALSTSAQSYSIDWYKIAGGGGSSTNGQFSLNGTIGQPDASGAMTGGNYSVTGGFWSLFSVVQTPGAPLLTITSVGNKVIVSWPLSATGWTLQTNNDLATGNWGNYGPVVNNRITNSPPTGKLFFRLKQ